MTTLDIAKSKLNNDNEGAMAYALVSIAEQLEQFYDLLRHYGDDRVYVETRPV